MFDRVFFIIVCLAVCANHLVRSQCPYANQNIQQSVQPAAYYPRIKLPIPYSYGQEYQGQSGVTYMTKTVQPSFQTVESSRPAVVESLPQGVAPVYIKTTAVESRPAFQTYSAASSYPIMSNYNSAPAYTNLPATVPMPAVTPCGQSIQLPSPPQYSIGIQGTQSVQPMQQISPIVQPTSPCTQSRLIQPSCGGCPESSPCGTTPCGSYQASYQKK